MDSDTDKDKVRNLDTDSDTSLSEYVSELSDKFNGHLTGTLFLPSRHQIPLYKNHWESQNNISANAAFIVMLKG